MWTREIETQWIENDDLNRIYTNLFTSVIERLYLR